MSVDEDLLAELDAQVAKDAELRRPEKSDAIAMLRRVAGAFVDDEHQVCRGLDSRRPCLMIDHDEAAPAGWSSRRCGTTMTTSMRTASSKSTTSWITGRHRFWSVDRRGWVRVESLYIGERLESRGGVVTVAELGPVPGRHEVFNLMLGGRPRVSGGSGGRADP